MNNKKCKGCQWYNKPYWSIINPCDNCSRDDIQVITRCVDTTIEQLQQENKQLRKDYARITQDNCYTLELEKRVDKAIEEIKKELKENNHLSYGVALSIIGILNNYEEILKGE